MYSLASSCAFCSVSDSVTVSVSWTTFDSSSHASCVETFNVSSVSISHVSSLLSSRVSGVVISGSGSKVSVIPSTSPSSVCMFCCGVSSSQTNNTSVSGGVTDRLSAEGSNASSVLSAEDISVSGCVASVSGDTRESGSS